MNKVFVIERMFIDGVWELLSHTFYTDEKIATNEALSLMETMNKANKTFILRVTTLNLNK